MQLPSVVSGSEPLARYIVNDRWYKKSTREVKPRAFEPPPDNRLSVFRILCMNCQEILENGQTNVVDKRPDNTQLHGFAEIMMSDVEDLMLKIDPDNIPERHASIIGWPDDLGEIKSRAQELAAKAKLVLKSDCE